MGHPSTFQRVLRLGSITARHSSSWASAKLCGVERRAPPVTGQLANTPTRGLPTLGLDKSRTGELAVLQMPPKERKLSTESRRWHPRVVQSARWQSASWRRPIHELSSNRATYFFSRAAITLGIGSLSSCSIICRSPDPSVPEPFP